MAISPNNRKRVLRAIRKDIFFFAKLIGFEPTWQQAQLLGAVQEGTMSGGPIRIACRSGQGPGKTTSTVVVALWRSLRKRNHKIILTAPTMRQCKDVFLAELELVLGRAPKLVRRWFNVTNTTFGVMGNKAKNWGLMAITATSSEAAQGQHRESMDVIAEEASGVRREIIEQFKGTLSNPGSMFLMIGNPNTRDCAFFDCFYGPTAHKWVHLAWNAEETPASAWFDPQRNEEIAEEFGRDSDIYRIRILGEFPRMDPECLMSDEDVDACMRPEMKLPMSRLNRTKTIGLDFARHGGDESVAFQRAGNAIVDWGVKHREEPNIIVDVALQMQARRHWRNHETVYVADACGIGEGVLFKLLEAERRVYEFKANRRATSRHYANIVTQAWFHLAKLVREHRCYLPLDRQLKQQLCSRKYTTDKKGRVILEDKDAYKKRTGLPSPDRADAIVMAFFDPAFASKVAFANS